MKKDLQNKIFKKYPKLFRQKDLSMQETCMCWGIDCPDSWFNLLDELCSKIQTYCNKQNIQIEAVQVKEKYGYLRFYTTYEDDIISGYIDLAEQASMKICAECGSTKKVLPTSGWVSYFCSNCIKKEQK
jgi:hypothetical protein